jgi:hypothetical protein
MLFFAVILLSTLFTSAVLAAPKDDIVAQARSSLLAGRPLELCIAQALALASKSDIAPPDLAAELAESLMQGGIGVKMDGVALADNIVTDMVKALKDSGADDNTILRTIPPMVQGIRAAADRNKLDVMVVQKKIEDALGTSGGNLTAQLVQMAQAAYGEQHAETYTPATPGATPPPAPAPSAGGGVSGAYDSTASNSGSKH